MRRRERTEVKPAQIFLGALTPMAGLVAAAPPDMVEQKVKVYSGGRLVLQGGREVAAKRAEGSERRDACVLIEIRPPRAMGCLFIEGMFS